MSAPNLKRIALFIQKILTVTQNLEFGSRDPGYANLNISHKCYDRGLRASYDQNSHGARTVAVESHGRREIFLDIFYPSYDES